MTYFFQQARADLGHAVTHLAQDIHEDGAAEVIAKIRAAEAELELWGHRQRQRDKALSVTRNGPTLQR